MRDVAVISIWQRCYGIIGIDQPLQPVSVLLYPARPGTLNGGASTRTSSQIFVVCCAVHIAVEKASKSGHVLRGKRRRLDSEDIVPTPTADAADESNVEDRSVFRFSFSVRYCIIADQHTYVCASVFVCITLRVCK